MTVIAEARPSLALNSLDLCTPARQAGWRHAEVVRPDELLCGAAMLRLAGQSISVRLVMCTGEDSGPLLERLRHDVLHAFFLEQFIVMVDFPPETIRAYQATFLGVTTRRVTVGSRLDYLAWLPARLGPLRALPLTSPVRRLTEHLLCVSSAPEPREKRRLACSYEGSAIRPQFEKGQLGVQAVETLFGYTRGATGVVNVEADPKWQSKDVDLLVRESGLGGRLIQVEIKNEDKTTGNIVLEKYSCFERKTTGWLDYSSAEVLCSCLWPTGDLLLMDLAKVREWVRTTKRNLRLVLGTVPQQNYHSQVHLAPVSTLLEDLPEVVHLRIGDWLPTLYQGVFAEKSLVPSRLKQKTLVPQRLDWPA
ncbi:hypothetical protein WJ97_13270 [Burkholderia ubonensis]|uniref:hypothetical protein n=1 Tax=Burkholderia ubonensis TaxID=101571 RepID=UPI00075A2365|nr:hypothetical protein [Burkholderia ubonensis]KVP96844.1 hypothetical protein WJ97_13270 [Burkholderia ubonensis]